MNRPVAASIAVDTFLIFLLVSAPARAASPGPSEADGGLAPFAWTISASPADPYVNTAPPTGGLGVLYLWLSRAGTGGLPCGGAESAEFMISTAGGTVFVQFVPRPGFSNSGVFPCLSITADDCVEEPTVGGDMIVFGGAGQVCLEPCVSEFSARACGKPGAYPMAWRGFEFGAGPPCEKGQVVGHIDFGNACCLPDGTCTNVINDCACYELGGTPQGWPSGCTTAACCFADGSCMELLDYSDCAACEQMGGQVHYDQTCDAVDCTTTSADPLSWGRTKSVYR